MMMRIRSRSSRRMLPTKRSAIALALGARTGVVMMRTSSAVNTASNVCGELGVTVPDEKPEAAAGVLEVHEQVASLLSEPGPGGVGGDAEDVYAAGGVLDDNEDIQPTQGDGVEMKHVAGQDGVRLRV